MTRIRQAVARFWTTDRGLSVFLVLLLVVVFVLPPLASPGVVGRALTDAVFAVLLIAGTVAVAERRWVLWIVAVATVAALLVHVASWLPVTGELLAWRVGSALLAQALMTAVILVQVFRPGSVTLHRILGAVAAYLLLGLVWAQAYQLVSLAHPGAFTGAVDAGADSAWVYFSFVTLTTTGYGDTAPVHALARSLANLEALIGQLYPAILLARLVSLELTSGAKPPRRRVRRTDKR